VRDPGPITALLVALLIAALYTQGGVFQGIAALIILAVLISRVGGQPSIAEGLFSTGQNLLQKGLKSGA